MDFNETEVYVVQHEYAYARPNPIMQGSSRYAPHLERYEQGTEIKVLKHINLLDAQGLLWKRLPSEKEAWVAVGYPEQQIIFLTSKEEYVIVTE